MLDMKLSRFLRPRNFAALLFAVVMSGAVYGFAAANTVPASGAGDGSAAISGYTASNVTYTLNSTDPSKIDAVKFALAGGAGVAAPVTVKAQLVASGTWSCDTTGGGGTSVATAGQLRIVAAQ
jgi:hypothetical protein